MALPSGGLSPLPPPSTLPCSSPLGLGCVSPEEKAQVPTRPGCSLAGWLIGPHLDLIRHGAPPEANAAFIAHSADLDRRKMAADMLHFLGSCLKAVGSGESRVGGSIHALPHMDGRPYECLWDHSSAELFPRNGICP